MDEIKNEVAKTIKRTLEIFTVQYTKAYLLAMVRLIELEANRKPKEWQLESRPEYKEPLKSGYLLKESKWLKKMNKKYFVFRPNYVADFYASEEEAAKENGKRLGSLNLTGYWVASDPNTGIAVRLKRLAEKMGMDLSNLPKPKEYPPLTFEVYHSRRQTFYLQASTQEEFDAWVSQFRTACWKARGLTWDDWCHQRAFPIALRKTRWEMGRWGYYYGSGSEEQLLSELIADELEYEIMGKMYSKLPNLPYFIRNKIANFTLSTINSMVISAVKPAWAGMRKAVEELRPKLEPTMRSSLEPLFQAKAEIMDKMRAGVMSVLEPILRDHVVPHLAKIVAIIQSPINDAFTETFTLFEAKVDKWDPKDAADLTKTFRDVDYLGRSYWELRSALKHTDDMYEPLWALHEVFSDIYPWHLIWKAHDTIYKHTDKAVYTWEQTVIKDGKETAEKAKALTLEKFRHDAKIASVNYYAAILKKIVMPGFETLVHPASKAIIEPLASLVPDPLKEFIDINQMFEDLYNGVIDDSINVVLRG